jgi:Skp family chaperone for outer membrane proteins
MTPSLVGGCLVAVLAAAAPVGAGQAEQKLAMVNVSMVFEKYDKVPEIQRRIDAKYKKDRDDLQRRAEELSARNKELEQLYNQARSEEVVFDRIQKLRKDQFTFERDLNRMNADMQKDYTRDMREVLTDIRVAVRTIAEQGGYEMVLRSPDTDDPEVIEKPAGNAEAEKNTYLSLVAPKTVAQLVERFNRNPVLHGARTVDITPDVLTKLNQDYRKRTGATK